MGKRNRSSLLPTNLPQLQNLIKRDSISYRDDFLQQYRHYESQLDIFKIKPDEETEEFGSLITFISQVAHCFPDETSNFPQQIINLLSENYQILHPDLRKTMVQCLVLLRNKDIISNIKNTNSKHKNNKLNKTLQNFMYTILQNTTLTNNNGGSNNNSLASSILSAKVSTSSSTKSKTTTTTSELGEDENQDDDSDNNVEVDLPDIKRLQHINQINKSKKSKTRKLEKALSTIRKKERQKHKAENFNFSAINLINDPQGFAEKLFSSLQKSSNNDRFEVKLMIMNLISRIIGINKLILLNFYSYLLRYLQPHQRDVTMVLVILAQASHELVPPDVLEPVIKAVANKFVSDNCSSEVITAGLNGIREVCVRQPLAMDSTLLQDLTEYKGDRDKGVMMAARSLIGLFREINPEILKKRDRGKIASMSIKGFKPLKYGELNNNTSGQQIEGIELLEEYKEKLKNDGIEEDDTKEETDDKHTDAVNEKKISTLATTKLLTPADFAKLNELRMEQNVEKMIDGGGKRKRSQLQQSSKREETDDIVDLNNIVGPRKKAKQDYEERVESVKAGREGRKKYGGGPKNKKVEGASTTNKEKTRNKAFMMVIHKKNAIHKKRITLREKQMQLTRSHVFKRSYYKVNEKRTRIKDSFVANEVRKPENYYARNSSTGSEGEEFEALNSQQRRALKWRQFYHDNYIKVNFDLLENFPNWLYGLKLYKYSHLFANMKWQEIIKSNDIELKKLGVDSFLARKRLLKSFEYIKESMVMTDDRLQDGNKECNI
nr:5525_t:CDS:10 [Entrophospora candida]